MRRIPKVCIDRLAEECRLEEKEEATRINERFWKRFKWSMYKYYQPPDERSMVGTSAQAWDEYADIYGFEGFRSLYSCSQKSVAGDPISTSPPLAR